MIEWNKYNQEPPCPKKLHEYVPLNIEGIRVYSCHKCGVLVDEFTLKKWKEERRDVHTN